MHRLVTVCMYSCVCVCMPLLCSTILVLYHSRMVIFLFLSSNAAPKPPLPARPSKEGATKEKKLHKKIIHERYLAEKYAGKRDRDLQRMLYL